VSLIPLVRDGGGRWKNWKKNRRKRKEKEEPDAASEEFLARNRFRVYKMTHPLPSGILVPISLQRLSLNTRMQAVNGSNPLVASYSRVGLPGPSSSGPASRCSILGRVATVADIFTSGLYYEAVVKIITNGFHKTGGESATDKKYKNHS